MELVSVLHDEKMSNKLTNLSILFVNGITFFGSLDKDS